jgi:hypothetical protein
MVINKLITIYRQCGVSSCDVFGTGAIPQASIGGPDLFQYLYVKFIFSLKQLSKCCHVDMSH